VSLCLVWISNSYPSTKKAIFSSLKSWTQIKPKSIRTVKFYSIYKNSKLVPTTHCLAVSFKVKMICVSTKPSWPIPLSQRLSTETRKLDSFFLKKVLMKSILKLIRAIMTKLPLSKYPRQRHSGSFYANWWHLWSTWCSLWIWYSSLPTTLRRRLLLNLVTINSKTLCNWWLWLTNCYFSFSHSSFVLRLANTLPRISSRTKFNCSWKKKKICCVALSHSPKSTLLAAILKAANWLRKGLSQSLPLHQPLKPVCLPKVTSPNASYFKIYSISRPYSEPPAIASNHQLTSNLRAWRDPQSYSYASPCLVQTWSHL